MIYNLCWCICICKLYSFELFVFLVDSLKNLVSNGKLVTFSLQASTNFGSVAKVKNGSNQVSFLSFSFFFFFDMSVSLKVAYFT